MRLDALQVDKSSPVPLYYQLAERIKEQILAGVLPPGARLPSERELSLQTGMSRMTARQALAYLVHEGALKVKHGVGTFVTEPKLVYEALRFQGFSEAIAQRGGAPSSRVIEQIEIIAPERVAVGLELTVAERVYKVVRLRFADDLPLLLETSFIPCALCPGLHSVDLTTTSLYGLLEREYGVRLRRARQTLESTLATEYECALFGLSSGAPMLLAEGVAFRDDGRPAEYFKAVYRGDRLKFAWESLRTRAEPAHGEPRISLVIA